MEPISYPQCERGGIQFIISTGEDQSENVWFLSEDFPIAMFTQHFRHSAQDQIPFHWHNEIQMVWVYEGVLSYNVNGESFDVDRGKLLFINRHLFHSAKTTDCDARTLCIDFRETIFHPMILKHYILPFLDDPSCTCILIPLKPCQISTLERFTRWNERELGYFTVTNFLSQMMEDVVRNCEGSATLADYEEAHQFQTILEFVHSHYAEHLTIRDMTTFAHINKNQLTRMFNKYTNLSPIRYLNEYRLMQAKARIVRTDDSISRISEDVGYNQISYFIQQFRNMYGMTPLKYRNKYGKELDIPGKTERNFRLSGPADETL